MAKLAFVVRVVAVLYLLALLFFIWGWISAKLEFFPFKYIQPIYNEVEAFFVESHKDSVREMVAYDHQESRSEFPYVGFHLRDAGFQDDGYLLISRYSKQRKQTIVELFSIARAQVIYEWVPNVDQILDMSVGFSSGANTRAAYRSQHPLLMPNGDIVLSSGEGPLVRIDPCGDPVWISNRHFHHSIEVNAEGNLLVPINLSEEPNELGVPMRDDGIAIVSPDDGRILWTLPLHDLFMSSGYQGLLYGVGEFETDRFHLNDIQPVPGRPGEVLLSIRNISSVASLDLETQTLNWLKTGPWVNQHDVNPLSDGWISVFGNNFSRGAWKFVPPGHSEIYLYHPESDTVRMPYSTVLKEIDMHSEYEGRLKILDNGDAFVEETNRHRLLRVSPEKVRWEYVNGVTDRTTGALHWSRYLKHDAIYPETMENLRCER